MLPVIGNGFLKCLLRSLCRFSFYAGKLQELDPYSGYKAQDCCLFFLRMPVYSFHLFDKAFRVFADQTAVTHVLKDLAREGVALRFQLLQIRRKLFIYRSLDPVPDMHIGIFENTVIGLFTDQASVLILPAFPAGLGIEDSIRFLDASPCDLCQKAFAQLSRSAHDGGKKKQKRLLHRFCLG